MLETLRIQNYALIDDLEVDFTGGFNVLTGETGAGKSILVGALNVVLGGRASAESVRKGAKQARLDAAFRIQNPSRRLMRLFDEHTIELEDATLLLSRVVTAEGRSRAYVSGRLVPVAVLAAIGDELVDLHGQHEHQSLLKTDRQLELLDAFADTERDAADLARSVADLRKLEQAVAELESVDRSKARRADFLRFEMEEIDGVHLEPGEEAELRSRRNLIANTERICELTARAYALLYDSQERSAIDAVDAALSDLEALGEIDERFRPLTGQLTDVRANLDQIAAEVRGYTGEIDYDPAELDAVNARLAVIGNLKRKYGDSVDAILQYRDKAFEELQAFDQRDLRLADMRVRHDALAEEATQKAAALSGKRRAAAKKLDRQITAALQELGMKGGRFETHFETCNLAAAGIDRAEFLLAANPGETLKALRHVASGGEISRIMLALKAVFARADKIPTLIFDEIDAGVGGHIAGKVADKLSELAALHQTICVSHIPQIAAAAQTHHNVAKTTSKKRTTTTVSRVSGEARAEEIARLLDGSVSDVSLSHARELLAQHGTA
ncbi:MAG TPA: DNA repair protein RecN [Candidatus Hydrogenedentes bacterium]|nr:DNA repair protein RecN [Candidatus Hydrogenedentota bacterium]